MGGVPFSISHPSKLPSLGSSDYSVWLYVLISVQTRELITNFKNFFKKKSEMSEALQNSVTALTLLKIGLYRMQFAEDLESS